jgi:hypothetical protein
MTLKLRVLFPNQSIESIEVLGSDTPRKVALCGPPLKQPVVLLHHGQCLCPYLSLDSQGVSTGDLIIMQNVAAPSAKKPVKEGRERSDGKFAEMLRLADVAFAPYEVSVSADIAYRQMWAEQQQAAEAREIPWEPPKTVIGEPAQSVSDECLPSLWSVKRHWD